ncbi:hypothetical protein F7Q91_03435 [Vibrio chagasii]|uniref:Uncharacterized protein n=1 Tax=Vibrio chagasii TaxID=170679 RepID=A0A7V7TI19_9VIBR|nr:hypothetical protein [Vibrio chagasii]KAB0482475.1 hypothetical protein F7Q91_03435 [Vibrio chagasii]
MLKLTFDKPWIDKYWDEVEPKVMQSVAIFESREKWVVLEDEEALNSLNKIAQNLPEIANMPITGDIAIHAERIVTILACLPLKTSLAAYGWLGALSENQHKWNFIIYVYANQVVQGKQIESNPTVPYSEILIERVSLFNFLNEFNNVFLNDNTTKLALAQYEKRVKGDHR